MTITLLIAGFIIGWITHSVLSFKKYGTELNKLRREKWENTSQEEKMRIKLEAFKKILPNASDKELEDIVYSQDIN